MFCAFEVKFCGSVEQMLSKIRENGISATLLDANSVYSMQHLQAAYMLSSLAIKEKREIGKREESEFLLWLGCSMHMKNAIVKAGAKGGENCVFAVFGKKEKEALGAAKKIGMEIVGKVRENKEALNYWGVGGNGGREKKASLPGENAPPNFEKAGLKKNKPGKDEPLKRLIEKMAGARL